MIFEARCFHLKPAFYHLKPATYHLRPELARDSNIMWGFQMIKRASNENWGTQISLTPAKTMWLLLLLILEVHTLVHFDFINTLFSFKMNYTYNYTYNCINVVFLLTNIREKKRILLMNKITKISDEFIGDYSFPIAMRLMSTIILILISIYFIQVINGISLAYCNVLPIIDF